MSHPIPGHDYDEETLPDAPPEDEDSEDAGKYTVPPTKITEDEMEKIEDATNDFNG